MTRRPKPTANNTVTFRPDPDSGGRYGTLDCSWEEKPRKTAISREAAQRFAEGWKAEFKVKAAW